MNKKQKKIIINTDLGDDVDDMAAIIMAINSPEIEVIGITTVFQNTKRRAEMVLDLCEQYGKKIPVYVGYGRPLIEKIPYEKYPIQYKLMRRHHIVKTDVSAVDFLIESIKRDPEILILEMGPMTNLGMAFYKAPDIMKRAKILAMGGVFSQGTPEWNVRCDPEAARMVMDYAEYLIMFGLEVTRHCGLTNDDLQKLSDRKSKNVDYFLEGIKLFQEKTNYSVTLHDALLVAYLIDKETVGLKKSDYTVELAGDLTRGSVVLKENAYDLYTKTEKDFYYAEKIDSQRVIKLVLERIS